MELSEKEIEKSLSNREKFKDLCARIEKILEKLSPEEREELKKLNIELDDVTRELNGF